MNGGNDPMHRLQRLLEDFGPLLAEAKTQRQQTSEHFNVFEVLHVDGYEAYHSRFIAYLLDPTERHDQGDVFLTSFLQGLGLDFNPASTQGAGARTELSLGPSGRIDIYIRLANGQIILIENKVGAQEGENQISRYQNWLQRQYTPPGFPHGVVFLTPDGRCPETACRPEEVIRWSYVRVADWINHQAVGKPERLRVILEQYAETCRRIGGSTRRNAMPGEIRQFFLDPEKLETALEMETHLLDFRRGLHETFWQEVAEKLTERLRTNGYDPLWEVKFDDNLFGEGFNFRGGWQIAWRHRRNQRHFAMRVEFWPGRERGLFFGITRGAWIPENQVPKDTAIRERLHEQGFAIQTNYWCPGLRFFRDFGLPQFDLSRADDVLKLCREMQDGDRPLTHQIVKLTWKLFCDFRKELEDLNNNYPYDPPADANG